MPLQWRNIAILPKSAPSSRAVGITPLSSISLRTPDRAAQYVKPYVKTNKSN